MTLATGNLHHRDHRVCIVFDGHIDVDSTACSEVGVASQTNSESPQGCQEVRPIVTANMRTQQASHSLDTPIHSM